MKRTVLILSGILATSTLADEVGNLNQFVANQPASAAEVNENFSELKEEVNGNHARIKKLEDNPSSAYTDEKAINAVTNNQKFLDKADRTELHTRYTNQEALDAITASSAFSSKADKADLYTDDDARLAVLGLGNETKTLAMIIEEYIKKEYPVFITALNSPETDSSLANGQWVKLEMADNKKIDSHSGYRFDNSRVDPHAYVIQKSGVYDLKLSLTFGNNGTIEHFSFDTRVKIIRENGAERSLYSEKTQSNNTSATFDETIVYTRHIYFDQGDSLSIYATQNSGQTTILNQSQSFLTLTKVNPFRP